MAIPTFGARTLYRFGKKHTARATAARAVSKDVRTTRQLGGRRDAALALANPNATARQRYAAQDTMKRYERRKKTVYNNAYHRTIKRNRMIGVGVGMAGLGMTDNPSGTSANQNTFARNAMLGRNTVGISSGAVQDFDTARRSLGGM